MSTKAVPRAVLEERLRVANDRAQRIRMWWVSVGVYLALLLGIISSQALIVRGDLTVVVRPIRLGQLGGAVLIATLSYTKLEMDKRHLSGKARNVGRVLRNAFYHGFFWMTLLGVWP